MTAYIDDPLFAQAVQHVVVPLLRGTASAAVKRAADTLPLVNMQRCDVLTVDDETGTADVKVDGANPNDLPTEAIVIPPAPLPGKRGVILYGPGGEAYLLGRLGTVRTVVPDLAPVAIHGDEHGFQIGDTDDPNLMLDSKSIQARDGNESASAFATRLYLNPLGGTVQVARLAVGSASGPLSGAFLGHIALLTDDLSAWQYRFGSDWSHRVNIGPTSDLSSFAIVTDSDLDPTKQVFVVTVSGGKTFARFNKGFDVIAGAPLGISATTGVVGQISSSARYKQQIRDVDTAAVLASVLRIRPVRYRYRLPDSTIDEDVDTVIAPRVGLLAEDVAQHVPEAVIADGEGRPDAIDPGSMVGALVASVQALAARVEAQAAEITALRAQLDALTEEAP
jgi:hypothetical protein